MKREMCKCWEYWKNTFLSLVRALQGFSLVRKKRNNQPKGVWALRKLGTGRPPFLGPKKESNSEMYEKVASHPFVYKIPLTHIHTELWEGFLSVCKITQNKETGLSNILTNLPQTCPRHRWTDKESHLLIWGPGGNAVQGRSQGNFPIPPLALQAEKEGNEAEITGLV